MGSWSPSKLGNVKETSTLVHGPELGQATAQLLLKVKLIGNARGM